MKKNLRATVQWMACILLFLSSLATQAQDRRVTGKITTATDNTALPGANVQVKGTTVGTVTDADGNFALERTRK